MTSRLLAVIPEAATVSICLDMAAAAADTLDGATIEALHVIVDPMRLVAPAEEIDFQLLREKYDGTAAQRAARAHAVFDDWLAHHGEAPVSPIWKQIAGGEQDRICAEAKKFDVLVVPRGTNADGVEALHTALYCAGRPFFLAPMHPPAGVGLTDRIVIAWNNTPACLRAAEGALPWLKQSKHTVLLLVDGGETRLDPLTRQLVEAGISYQTVSIGRDQERLGDQIVSATKQLGATLLVLGAHRHGQVIEWLAGHTTDQVMAHSELPLLMAH